LLEAASLFAKFISATVAATIIEITIEAPSPHTIAQNLFSLMFFLLFPIITTPLLVSEDNKEGGFGEEALSFISLCREPIAALFL
tara:strand:+ start:2797 stop:3051 length:255 start_codon:yes stop_codon:yes gene_type:complete